LPPVAPQPTVTTAGDVADQGPTGSMSALFPLLSGAGWLTALGILVGGYIRHRRR
jgi:hypothetical protein